MELESPVEDDGGAVGMYEADGFAVGGDGGPGGAYDVGDGIMTTQNLAALAAEGVAEPSMNHSALSHGAPGPDGVGASMAYAPRAPPPLAAPPASTDLRRSGEGHGVDVAVEFTAKLQQKVQSQAGELAAMQHQLTQARSYSALCEQVKSGRYS